MMTSGFWARARAIGDALALAARQLVREAVAAGGAEPDDLEQLAGPGLALLLVPRPLDGELLGDGVPDPHPGIERAVRVLEHGPDESPVAPRLGDAEPVQVGALEQDLAGGRPFEVEQHPRQGRLAAAGLADEAERAPLDDGEVDVDQRVDLAGPAAARGTSW